MLYLDGKSHGWQNFNSNHQKAIAETILMVTSFFFFTLKGYLLFFSSNIGDSVSLHLKLTVLRGKKWDY